MQILETALNKNAFSNLEVNMTKNSSFGDFDKEHWKKNNAAGLLFLKNTIAKGKD